MPICQIRVPFSPACLFFRRHLLTPPLEILYHDAHLVAVHKPAGLLVHRSKIDRTATAFALQMVRDQTGQYVYPVHRLDKPTSGVLLFALSPEVARTLSTAFAERAVQKTYRAVVRGYTADTGTIDHALQERLDKTTDARARPDKPPQPAVTDYRTLARVELDEAVDRYPTSRYSLVEAMPRTGRKHQLRRHFKHIAHPIIGDRKYGKNVHNDFFIRRFGCRRLLLHASALVFPHPVDARTVTLTAPLNGGFQQVVAALFGADLA